jgi:glycosyltransferase involved in cell wall biosynthesis
VRVAFHADQLWFSAPGGIGSYVRELLRAIPIVEPRTELIPFRSRWPRDRAPVPLATDGTLRWIEVRWSTRALYPAWDWLRWPPLPSPLADLDLVHATNPAAVPPATARQATVVTVHDLAFERFPQLFPRRWRWLYQQGLRVAVTRADALIVPSASVRRELVERHGVSEDRIHVTPLAPLRSSDGASAIDAGRAELVDRGVKRPYLLAVGTIEPRKNLVSLVRAYRHLAAAGCEQDLVLLGGDGWRDDHLRVELAKQGPGRIVRAGIVSPNALAAAYADADLVAYLSLYEGFGLPVLEAMAAGVPVVASNRASIPEVAGDAAVLVDPEDVEAVADAVGRVLADPELAETLRRLGRARAGGYSWEATARATLDVYRIAFGGT